MEDAMRRQILYYRLKDAQTIDEDDIIMCYYDSEGNPIIDGKQAAYSLVLTRDTPCRIMEGD